MTRLYDRRVSAAFLHAARPPTQNVVERLLLYGFPTGDATVAGVHVTALQRYILPQLTANSPPASVWVGGMASRRGDAGLNARLARQRAYNVSSHLAGRGGSAFQAHSVATHDFGERLSGHTLNSEYYRSVLVVVSRRPVPARIHTPPAWEVDLSTRFKIRMLYGNQVGRVMEVAEIAFEIDYDDPNAPSRPAFYRLLGVAVNVSASLPVDSTDFGDWESFRTPAIASTTQFGGTASFSDLLTWCSFELMSELGRFVFPTFATPPSYSVGLNYAQGPFVLRSIQTRD